MLPVQIAEPLVGGAGHAVGKAAGNNGQEKEWQTQYERFPPDCHAPHDLETVFKSSTAVGGASNPYQVRPTVWSCPWPTSP